MAKEVPDDSNTIFLDCHLERENKTQVRNPFHSVDTSAEGSLQVQLGFMFLNSCNMGKDWDSRISCLAPGFSAKKLNLLSAS